MNSPTIRKVERWITPDGREWPDAASAAEHQRLARLREWFERNVGGNAEGFAFDFDREFAHTPRERP